MNTPDIATEVQPEDEGNRADRLSLMASILGSYLGKNFRFDGSRPYYLSSLLPQLRKNLPTWSAETESVLKAVVVDHGSLNAALTEMANMHPGVFPYRIVRHFDSPGKIGLVPADSTFEYSDSEEPKRRAPAAKQQKTPRTAGAKTSPATQGRGRTSPATTNDNRLPSAILVEISNILKEILSTIQKSLSD